MRRFGAAAAYGAMIAGAFGLFALIQRRGASLVAPSPVGVVFGAAPVHHRVEVLPRVLIALLVIVVASRALGALFRRLKQPAVVGEVVAGILLGPSLLGRVAPEVAGYLLPREIAPQLGVIAQVGVILFMFLVGVELDTAALRRRTHASVAISHASIVAPFLSGAALSLWIYPQLSSRDVPFGYFALFMGVSMSVTAFPVLARILTDQGMQRTRIGVIALTCAAVDDVTAWCLLALVVGVVHARAGGVVVTLGCTVLYVAVMLLVVRPLAGRLVREQEARGALSQSGTAVVFVALLASALATEAIGIHALFGAFLLGAVVPHDSSVAREIAGKVEDLVVVLLLPVFFAFTGLRTQIGLVSGGAQWLVCGVIVLVACAGKFGGTLVAARLTGLGWRDSASLGVLMNTRGLMELIVLNVGLDLHLLSPSLFAMMVLMAVTTTLLTAPALRLLSRGARTEPGEPTPT